jgi:transcriptional regulator with XRE-family HTH domain
MDEQRRASIGATVRTLRESQGKTRQELASAAKISLEMLAKIEQGRKAPSAATLAGLAWGLGIEPPDLAHRANAWEAFATAGASMATLRAGTIAGTLGIRGGPIGASLVGPVGIAAAAGVAAIQRESRKRRQLEALLLSTLEQLTDDDLQDVDLDDIANRLGVDLPDETSTNGSDKS